MKRLLATLALVLACSSAARATVAIGNGYPGGGSSSNSSWIPVTWNSPTGGTAVNNGGSQWAITKGAGVYVISDNSVMLNIGDTVEYRFTVGPSFSLNQGIFLSTSTSSLGGIQGYGNNSSVFEVDTAGGSSQSGGVAGTSAPQFTVQAVCSQSGSISWHAQEGAGSFYGRDDFSGYPITVGTPVRFYFGVIIISGTLDIVAAQYRVTPGTSS